MNLRLPVIYISTFGIVTAETIQNNVGITFDGKIGTKLLSKAQLIDGRHLEDENQWIADYSIKFRQCHSFYNFAGEDGGNDGDDDMFENFYQQKMVTFQLCPSNQCYSSSNKACSGGGQYVVGMMDFVNAYYESKLQEQERNCENVRENCYCNDDTDDEVCEQQCYEDAGLDYCVEEENDDDRVEEFELEDYLECKEMEVNNNNNNNNNNNVQYFIGPKCSSDGYSINLGVFTDENCITSTNAAVYKDYNYYGNALPYSSKSIVDSDCVSCLEPEEEDDNDEDDDGREVEITELCQQMYEESGKCEQDINGLYYPKNGGCDYINNILPSISKAYSGESKQVSSSSNSNANEDDIPYFTYGFGAATLILAFYSVFLCKKISDSKRSVDLSLQGVV